MCGCDCCGKKRKDIDPARARWIQKRRRLRKSVLGILAWVSRWLVWVTVVRSR